jgi:hypothetical protein
MAIKYEFYERREFHIYTGDADAPLVILELLVLYNWCIGMH